MKLGKEAYLIQSEEGYWQKRSAYYDALKLGVNYWETDFKKATAFFELLDQEYFLLPKSV